MKYLTPEPLIVPAWRSAACQAGRKGRRKGKIHFGLKQLLVWTQNHTNSHHKTNKVHEAGKVQLWRELSLHTTWTKKPNNPLVKAGGYGLWVQLWVTMKFWNETNDQEKILFIISHKKTLSWYCVGLSYAAKTALTLQGMVSGHVPWCLSPRQWQHVGLV